MNGTMDWNNIPGCQLSEGTEEIIKRILGLRAKLGMCRNILIQKMDVKSAFHHTGLDPAGAAAFGYVVGGYVVVDMRLQFGRRGRPGWRGVVASAMQDAQQKLRHGRQWQFQRFLGVSQSYIACKDSTY